MMRFANNKKFANSQLGELLAWPGFFVQSETRRFQQC